MLIYNTMKREKEFFEKKKYNKNINLFVCGPTVYDDAHIGHGRTYIAFDMIKSYLEFIGYSVFYIENITDIDDKIIMRAKENNTDPADLAIYYEKRFKEDMKKLNADSVNLYPRATYHMNEIFNQIQVLIDKGFAYETETGVYFETSKFKDFGKLSNRDLEKLDSHRINVDSTKKDPKDFALWKKTNENPYYESKWGNGRPGWHIEDTAITEKYFGPQYDIHGGGLDLIFPHHDAEIAQMEAISGKEPLVKYWMHTGFLNVDGVKMSKSLGNFITIRDLLEKWDPMAYRLFVLSTHYRSPIDFSSKSLEQASKNLDRLNKTIESLKDTSIKLEKFSSIEIINETNEIESKNSKNTLDNNLDKNRLDKDNLNKNKLDKNNLNKVNLAKEEFLKNMDDDFNTPKALATILSFTKTINSNIKIINEKEANELGIDDYKFIQESLSLLKDFNSVFRLDLFDKKEEVEEDKSSELLEIIINTREKLRESKNYQLSDEIRDKLNEIGINIED